MSKIEFISLPDLNGSENTEMIHFLDHILAHQVDERVWNWEFNTLPGTIFTVAKDDTKIAGIHSMLPVTLSINNELTNTTKSETGYVDKDYRGKQLYENLFNFAGKIVIVDGVKMTWGFTPAVKAFRDNLKCVVREDLNYLSQIRISYTHFRKNRSRSRNLLFAIGKYVVHNVYALKNRVSAGSLFLYDKEIIEKSLLHKETDINELYSTIKEVHKDLIYLDLNKNYLNWRVYQNPALAYKTHFFYKENVLVGYIIYSVTDEVLIITDLTYANDINILKHMLKYLLNANKNYSSLQYWGNYKCPLNAALFNELKNIGAKTTLDKNRNLIYKIYSSGLDNEKVNDMNNWYINGLWTEGFNI